MSDDDTLSPFDGFPPALTRSIFPVFAVNVPMPQDTAVPGSYGRAAPRLPIDPGMSQIVTPRT